MTTSKVSGSVTTDGTEQNIFGSDPTGDKIYSCQLNCHNMQDGDSIEVYVYSLDSQTSVMRKFKDAVVISGLQIEPAYLIRAIPTAQYRVAIKRIAGVDREYTWTRWESV